MSLLKKYNQNGQTIKYQKNTTVVMKYELSMGFINYDRLLALVFAGGINTKRYELLYKRRT